MRTRCRFTPAIAATVLAASIVSQISPLRSQPIDRGDVEQVVEPPDPLEGLRSDLTSDRSFEEKEIKRMLELAQMPFIKAAVQQRLIQEREKDRVTARKYNLEGGDLYPNPIVAQWINQIGQTLVPPHSKNIYLFRVIEDPLPKSVGSSSGSIYITTGMLALLGSEGQLAFILAHEIAHLERDHFYHRFMGQAVEAQLRYEQENKKGIGNFFRGAATSAFSGATEDLLGETASANWGRTLVDALAGPRLPTPTDWNRIQEKEADLYGLQLALQADYDVSDAVGVLIALRREIQEDPRIEAKLHFNSIPIEARIEQVSRFLAEELKPLWEERKGNLLGTSPRFQFMIAEVRRDNGIHAVQEDLFAMARRNLERAIAIRSDDALAHYYLGKVYTWASREDLTLKAEHHFEQSIRWDADRHLMPEPHLEIGLLLLRTDDPRHIPRIQKELRTYVRLFVNNNQFYGRAEDAIPAGLPIIYDRLRLIGDSKWRLEDDIEAAAQQQKTNGN